MVDSIDKIYFLLHFPKMFPNCSEKLKNCEINLAKSAKNELLRNKNVSLH